MTDLPLVSIVTPTLNTGAFLEETIRSVLRQDYPNVEYIVMDGGSTDNTLSILEQYADRLTFHSAPDGGTADAINRGFERASGSIFAFLNADDTYYPGAISAAVAGLLAEPASGVVYGEGQWVAESGEIIGPYPTKPFDASLLRQECFICQPAAFIRREAFELAGGMDPKLQFAFDYDLWIRIARLFPLRKLNALLATSRMHKANKTVGQRKAMLRETIQVLRNQFGYAPFGLIHTYASYLADGRDQFFEPLRPTLYKYLVSLPIGIRYNWRRPLRFAWEWAGVMGASAGRRWRDSTGNVAN